MYAQTNYRDDRKHERSQIVEFETERNRKPTELQPFPRCREIALATEHQHERRDGEHSAGADRDLRGKRTLPPQEKRDKRRRSEWQQKDEKSELDGRHQSESSEE